MPPVVDVLTSQLACERASTANSGASFPWPICLFPVNSQQQTSDVSTTVDTLLTYLWPMTMAIIL